MRITEFAKEHLNSRKRRIAIVVLAALILLCVILTLVFLSGKDEKEDIEYQNVKVTTNTMTQTLMASGKVTAGKTERVPLTKGKFFKAALVDKDEAVSKGQPLVYYTDGTHTDAPAKGIITDITVPDNGKAVSSTDCVTFRSTKKLYMTVKIPEDKINEISKGEKVEITVNAYPDKKFEGKILSKNGISNALISEGEESNDEDDSGGDSDSDETNDDLTEDTSDEEAYDNESYDEDSDSYYDDSGDESGEDGEGSDIAYYEVRIKFKNDGSILPGMSATSVTTISERTGVISIPVSAVYFDKNGNTYVYKNDNGNISKQKVTTGESDSMNVEILDGLTTGQTVRMVKIN